jgi:hypothetical protein
MELSTALTSPTIKKLFFAFVCLFFTMGVHTAVAQTGSIEGVVTDTDGEPLPGATVMVNNPDRGLERGTATGPEGRYRILSLPTGSYEVSASFVGFQTVLKENIQLRIDQTLRVDFELRDQSGELDEVQVVAESQAIEMNEPSVASPITAEQIENQPTFSRNVLELGKLVPGGRSRGEGGAEFGGGSSQPGTQSPTGAVFDEFIVDGVSWKDRSAGSTLTGDKDAAMITQEAIDEMRFITSGYDAQFRGGASVAVIETIRGTNEFQGSAFSTGFSSAFRSQGAFEQGDIEDSRRFQYGGALSGPIIKDRLFFNVAFEEEEETIPVTFNPGSEVWSEYAGTQIFPAGQRLLTAGLTGRISQKHALDLTTHFRREGDPVQLGGAVTEDWGWTQDQQVSVFHLRHRYTPGGKATNDFNLSHQRRQWYTQPLTNEVTRVFPGISLGPLNFLWPLQQTDYVTKVTNHFTYLKADWFGDHIFKIGGEVGYSDLREDWPLLQTPAFIFGVDDPEADPIIGQIAVGRNVLEGETSDLTSTESAVVDNDSWQLSFYAQDEWDVLPNLRLSLGLRWSAEVGHLNNDFEVPDDFAASLRDAGVPEAYIAKGERKNDLDNFAPRIRFSWDLFDTGRTTVSGGYARSFDRPPANDIDREEREANWLTHTVIFNNNPSLPDDVRPDFPDPTTDPDELRELVLSGEANLQPDITLLRDEIEHPVTDDFTIGVRQQFRNNIRGSINLVAKNTRNGFGSWNFNPLQEGLRKQTPDFGNILLSGDFWSRQYRAALLTVRREYQDDWMFQFNYALSSTETEVMRPNSPEPFEDVSGSGDERHRFAINGIYNLPLGFRISGFATVASPIPINATDGRDLNGDGNFDNDFLGGQPFNFRPEGFENWYRKIDLRVTKSFAVAGSGVELQADFFNVLNNDNFSGYFDRRRDADGEPLESFGEPISAFEPRRIQFGARISF